MPEIYLTVYEFCIINVLICKHLFTYNDKKKKMLASTHVLCTSCVFVSVLVSHYALCHIKMFYCCCFEQDVLSYSYHVVLYYILTCFK